MEGATVIAQALQAVAAFNLVCTGTVRTGPVGIALPEAGGTPYTITYRVDLAGNQWCSDNCDTTEPLALVTDGEILLREDHRPDGSHVIIVGRHLGLFADTAIAGRTAILRSGTCVQAPFTGFPIPSA
jgi:hypothetical protein